MTISRRPLHCRACDKNFMQEMLENVAIAVWATHVKSIRCPHCGVNFKKVDLLVGDAYLAAWNELHPDDQIAPEQWAATIERENRR